ncbi:probable ATP-dependent DNA helicase HFM1 [Ornithodoros turicata]|uniref:probable ATP-dependent DNA helicase HFM1 n=1 Tax=Ornithodoros turicata TaxID=34597 RepID=UPI00313A2B07
MPRGLKAVNELRILRYMLETEKYCSIFKEFPYFNRVQSEVFDDVMNSDSSLVVAAPTGSGKTVIFELALIRLLMRKSFQEIDRSSRAIHMVPLKAICAERYKDWQEKFRPHGISCAEFTGDTDDSRALESADVVLTTPEKWESATRRWRDHPTLMKSVSLFLIDEIHLLSDDSRGPVLEAVVSRMKTMQSAQKSASGLRFIGVSATIPNADDVAEWLGSKDSPGKHYVIGESHRPVQLKKVVIGYPYRQGGEFKFDISLSYKVPAIINSYSEGKPTIVFCSTRKGVVQTATTIAKCSRFAASAAQLQRLIERAALLHDSKLKELLSAGIAYHHAGLGMNDRTMIEEMFQSCDLPVLVSTSTLAMGVNLPAHLVIIKSTTTYSHGKSTVYPDHQVAQMIGRAGRPQFDTSGTAVIMTKDSLKEKYENFLHGTQMVESSLHKSIVEHLNAEIVLNTITDLSESVEWIKSTFFYTRVLKNPTYYEICLKGINALAAVQLVNMNADSTELTPTEAGRVMARYSISFETMKKFADMPQRVTLCELVTMLSTCAEYSDIQLRTSEKMTLNALNSSKSSTTIRFPLKGRIKTRDMKVNCLLQAILGCLPIADPSLGQDVSRILRVGQRLSKALLEYILQRQQKSFSSIVNAVTLCKCLQAKLWENSHHVARQINKIGVALSNAFVKAGVTSLEKIMSSNPRELELIVKRNPPFGSQIIEAVRRFPRYDVSVDQALPVQDNRAAICVTLRLTNAEDNQGNAMFQPAVHLLVGDADDKPVLNQRIEQRVLTSCGPWKRTLTVTRSASGEKLTVNVVNEKIVGVDIRMTFTPKYLTPLKKLETDQQGIFSKTPKARSSTPKPAQSNGATPSTCGHKCNDKTACKHNCCKAQWTPTKQTEFVRNSLPHTDVPLRSPYFKGRAPQPSNHIAPIFHSLSQRKRKVQENGTGAAQESVGESTLKQPKVTADHKPEREIHISSQASRARAVPPRPNVNVKQPSVVQDKLLLSGASNVSSATSIERSKRTRHREDFDLEVDDSLDGLEVDDLFGEVDNSFLIDSAVLQDECIIETANIEDHEDNHVQNKGSASTSNIPNVSPKTQRRHGIGGGERVGCGPSSSNYISSPWFSNGLEQSAAGCSTTRKPVQRECVEALEDAISKYFGDPEEELRRVISIVNQRYCKKGYFDINAEED